MPYINNHTPSHHAAGSRLKAAMEMSGERISGPVEVPTSSGDASGLAGDETFGGENDDVELEKSNILMLGPTGATCSVCIQIVLSTQIYVCRLKVDSFPG